jgi:diaminopropionate ammonia-lyase
MVPMVNAAQPRRDGETRGRAALDPASVVSVPAETAILVNPGRVPYGCADRELLGRRHAGRALATMAACPVYRPTALRPAPLLAEAAGVGSVLVKDESDRFGSGSFKGLGGAYAVITLAATSGDRPVFVCASAGNHGLSVAAGARVAGCRAQIWLSTQVPAGFVARLRALGADVRQVGGTYEDSIAAASAAAARPGHVLVSDTSRAGDLTIPLQVMRGYTALAHEAAESMAAAGGPASHVFVQSGVGGLAAAVSGYLRDRWGERTRLVVVEPAAAACLRASAAAGVLTEVPPGAPTALGRLDCRRPSLLAWQVLSRLADAFTT